MIIPSFQKSKIGISIHSLRMEGDHKVLFVEFVSLKHFNPLPPHGGRLCRFCNFYKIVGFQSTPSAWRETLYFDVAKLRIFISIHSLRMEGDDYV